jgi:hypothetical protein
MFTETPLVRASSARNPLPSGSSAAWPHDDFPLLLITGYLVERAAVTEPRFYF